ncbi:MAG: hypothetical protein J0I15_14700 [Herbaspirillum huttiense]|uniref:hypothetical protein n=1 Tax=Herbaspirillum huttiense TaxID=863372 RepID=UPI001AC79069|nr:hypothetical protein [Herbaspirillum huttiense]MBN9357697.1 hypothetical protein [Herbaspirillum huttiense]
MAAIYQKQAFSVLPNEPSRADDMSVPANADRLATLSRLVARGENAGRHVKPLIRSLLPVQLHFLGFNTGYKTDTWSVIEIDPTNMLPTVIAPDFSTFIRKKIHELTLTRE